MAIHNPSNLYSNGQYTIDSNPFTKLVLSQQAKKKAAKEAVNKSMTDLMSKINIAGVRQQDLDGENGGILKDIENWKKNSMANKDAILKGGEAQQRQMLDYQTLLHNIQKSKDAAKRQLEIGKANAEGKLDLDDEDLPVLDNMNQSIYNPAHYKEDGSEHGWNDLPANLPKFTPEKQDRFFNVAAGKNQPTYDETKVRVDNVTGKVFIPQGYAPEQIKEIAINSGNVFDGTPEAQRHYKKQLSNPQFMGEANTAFKTVFGKDIESPREAAQADAIMRAASANKEIQVTDPNYANKLKIDAENRAAEREAFRNKRNFKQSMAKIAANKAAGQPNEDVGYISDEVFSAAGEDASIPPVLAKRIGLNPTKSYKVVYADKVDPQRLNIITAADKDGIGGVAGINIPQEDGSTRSMYIVDESTGDWIGENGQVISREGAKDRYIKEVSPSKFKMQAGTKASEKRTTTTVKKGKYD